MSVALVVALLAASPSRAAAAPPAAAGEESVAAHEGADGADGADEHDADVGWWSFAAVPRLTFSVDDGFGLGFRGAAFWHRFDTSPYKTAITAQAWVTTNLVQQHYVRVDAVNAFNVPARMTAELGYLSAPHQNFGDGELLAIDEPYLEALARYRLADGAVFGAHAKLEIVGGARAGWFLPTSTEPGLLVAPLLGAVLDTRDFEPAPTKGVLLTAVVRRADPLLGSSWAYSGANAELDVFAPLTASRDVIIASRIVADAIFGDAPTVELGKIGGLTQSFAFGGQDLGRGLRSSRLIGPLKLMAQEEVRATFFHLDVFGNDLGVGGVAFLDAGAIGDASLRSVTLAYGAGVGVRVSWNRNFVTRLDVAMSPLEGARVGAYTGLGNAF